MRRALLMTVAALAVAAAPARGGFSKVGTAAAQFLKVGVGARAMGLGETFVAVANDATTLYWNPAGLANLSSVTLAVNHTEWFADIRHDFMGFVMPWSDKGVLGVSVITLNTPEQEVTTVEEPDGTGIYYDVNDIAVGLSFARALTDRFNTGVTLKYVQQNAYNEMASTVAGDIGSFLRTGYRDLAIAMSISNFGGTMQLQGRDLIGLVDIDGEHSGEYNPDARLKTEEWPLALNFRIGMAMEIVGGAESFFPDDDHQFMIALDGNHPNDNNERVNLGGEYSWNERLFIRAGYSCQVGATHDERVGAQRFSFGGGLTVPIGKQLLCVDYALADLEDLGKVGRFSVEYRF